MLPKPLALPEPVHQPMHELKDALFILETLLSNLNMVVPSAGQIRKLTFVTLIANMTVNGAHGQTMDANCLASLLPQDQAKTGKDKPARFNILRLTGVLNVPETVLSS
jgi:hypothetical protein